MAKSEKELNELKEKIENVTSELKELSDEELAIISGGMSEEEWSEYKKAAFSLTPTLLSLY